MARKIQPRSNVPQPKKGQSSEDYWREREERQRAVNIREEARTAARINEIFQTMQDSIQQEIESFYQRYADKEGITLAEARGRVSRIDMEQYERLARKYVEAAHRGDSDLAFSDEANEQMRLYNATMRINRLEMLKARCGIRAMEGYRDTERLINDNLEERAYSEYRRLAGILGNSVQFNENMVRAIVNASYQNATWSQRLWTHQATLSERIGAQLAQGILTGKSSIVLAREIQKLTGGSTYACQRLMRTELRRVQTEAALQSMSDNGVTEYKFMVANGVNPCEECLALDGQVFKLSEMTPGKNAPPVHPSCHCCTAPYVDEKKWQRWLDGPAQAGVPWEEFEEKGTVSDTSKIPESQPPYNRAEIQEIIERAKAAGATMSGIRDSLSDAEIRALQKYIGFDSYTLNEKLRNWEKPGYELTKEEREWARNLDLALFKLPDYNGVVFRSVGIERMIDEEAFNRRYQPGAVVLEDAFISSSKEYEYDNSFKYQMIIQSKHGKDISELNPDEREVLFKRGSMFIVTKREGSLIFLEEI